MFDPLVLRSFLAVADTHSFTKAALQLGLSQPTVSQHIRRLEQAAGRVLVSRDTHSVSLTDNGDAMAGFARTILSAHQAAEQYFSGAAMSGRVRFGAADDLAITQLPRILRHFRQLYPQVNLELTIDQSAPLYRKLHAGSLDLIFIKQKPETTDGQVVRRDTLVWIGQEKTLLEPGAPVPLVTYHGNSVSRQSAIEALENNGRPWRITCNTREVNGLLAGVRAGLGVAVFPHTLIPDDLVKVSNRFNLPPLGDVDFTLLRRPEPSPGTNTEAVAALASAIMGRTLNRSA